MTAQPDCKSLRIPVAEAFRAHADAAMTRLGYLYPSVRFTVADGAIEVCSAGAVDIAALQRDARYALYRQKIYADTLSMRTDLIKAVTRR